MGGGGPAGRQRVSGQPPRRRRGIGAPGRLPPPQSARVHPKPRPHPHYPPHTAHLLRQRPHSGGGRQRRAARGTWGVRRLPQAADEGCVECWSTSERRQHRPGQGVRPERGWNEWRSAGAARAVKARAATVWGHWEWPGWAALGGQQATMGAVESGRTLRPAPVHSRHPSLPNNGGLGLLHRLDGGRRRHPCPRPTPLRRRPASRRASHPRRT